MRVVASLRRSLVGARAVVVTAFRGMVTHRMRAFLSTLGIAIGVATLMGMQSITTGLSDLFAAQLASLGSSTLYVTSRPWIIRGDWWKYRNRPPITSKDVEALREHAPLLSAIAPVAFAMAEAQYLGERAGIVEVRGTTSEYLDTANMTIELGRFLSPLDVDLDQRVVVIGAEVRSRLFRDANPVGAQIRLGGERFTVVGALKAQGKAFGRSLDNLTIIPLGSFRKMFGVRRGLSIAVTAPPDRLHEAEEQVREVLRRSRALSADKEDDFSINQQAALVRMFNEDTRLLFQVAIAVGLITLVVGGIGVMNIMLVAVTERTREIGVRRALGARQRTILWQFLLEAMLVTLVGGLAGMAVGFGGTELLSIATDMPASATIRAALMGLAISAFAGLLFGTWPAYRAARLDPIESLRYE